MEIEVRITVNLTVSSADRKHLEQQTDKLEDILLRIARSFSSPDRSVSVEIEHEEYRSEEEGRA